jgi:choice-of-anchor B domain-containing protein
MKRILTILALALPVTVSAHDAAREQSGEQSGGRIGGLVDCAFGNAGGFSCTRIDMLSWLDLNQLGGSAGNDVWGWTDPLDGREYVLMGRFDGTTFVDITDPQAPVVLGYLPAHPDIAAVRSEQSAEVVTQTGGASKQCVADGPQGSDGVCGEQSSPWRDLKVYMNHAFIVSEQAGAGLQVFDLTQLRGLTGPPVTFGETNYNGLFSAAHNVAINVDTGFLYVVGSNRANGGLVIYDVSTPATPTWVADYGADGYTHDVQCVVYAGPDATYVGREMCFASNEDTLTILDASNKSSMQMIRRVSYPGVAYSHQAWLSEDHEFLYSNDELDELNTGDHTLTRIWDVRNLAAAQVVGTYESPLWSIDHNNYSSGDYLFQSNYTSGLRVLDISDPTSPWEIGYFDTYPATDDAQFNGTWSNYPYFPSGTIAVSDINGGLFLLQADFLIQPLATSDLSVEVGTVPSGTRVGDSVQQVITASNTSGVDAPDAQLTVSLDGPLTLTSFTPSQGSCSADGEAGRCRFGTLSAGSSVTVTVTFGANATGTGEIAAMVSGLVEDSDGSDNRDETTFAVAGSGQPGSGGSSSGGGSGPLLAMLLLLAGVSRRRGWSAKT